MESRINYSLIGLFVLLLGAAAIIIPLWLTSGLDQQQYHTYLVYMNESVDGLSVNAPVKYNGVDVGYVRDVQLNLADPRQVKIFLSIKQGIPITTMTTAELRDRGITGVVYVGLKSGDKNAPSLMAKPGEHYPVIPVAPSIRVKLDTGVTKLMSNMNKMSQQLDQVFNAQNVALLHQTLKNLDKVTSTLAANTQQVNHTLQSMNTLTQNLSQSSQNVPNMMDQVQMTTENFQALSMELRQNPSILLRGTAPLPLGPGEKQP